MWKFGPTMNFCWIVSIFRFHQSQKLRSSNTWENIYRSQGSSAYFKAVSDDIFRTFLLAKLAETQCPSSKLSFTIHTLPNSKLPLLYFHIQLSREVIIENLSLFSFSSNARVSHQNHKRLYKRNGKHLIRHVFISLSLHLYQMEIQGCKGAICFGYGFYMLIES